MPGKSWPWANMRVDPAISLTQSLTDAVCVAERNSPASDSVMFSGAGFSLPGTAEEVLLLRITMVTWLSMYTSFMNCTRWKFEFRLGSPTIAGFQGKLTLPFSSGSKPGLKELTLPSAMSRRALPGPVRLERLVLADLEEFGAMRLVHGDEGGSDPAGAGQELPPAHAQLLGDAIGVLLDAVLDLLLLLGLRIRQVLAVRDHLCRNRRMQVVGFICRLQALQLLLGEPGILFPGTRDSLWHGRPSRETRLR